MPSEPNMDRFHEGRSLRGRDDEAAHLRELEAEDLRREQQKDRELFREQSALGFVFKKKEDRP